MKILVILTALCFALTGISFAGTVVVTEVVTSGNLTLTMPSNFSLSGVTIGGSSTQTAQGLATYTVEDARGTGVGWNLGFQIGQFVTAGTPQRTIATSKSSMNLDNQEIVATWGQAVDGTNGPKSLIELTPVSTTEVKGVTALAGYGMGKYTIAPNHILTVDADRYAGTYTATLTATLNAVP